MKQVLQGLMISIALGACVSAMVDINHMQINLEHIDFLLSKQSLEYSH